MIMKRLRFLATGPSLLEKEPYQKAIPDNIKAVSEIGQYIGESNKAILRTKSKIEIIGSAYCKMKK